NGNLQVCSCINEPNWINEKRNQYLSGSLNFRSHNGSFYNSLLRFLSINHASSPPDPSMTPETISTSPIKCAGIIDSPKKIAAPINEKNVFKLRKIDVSAGPT